MRVWECHLWLSLACVLSSSGSTAWAVSKSWTTGAGDFSNPVAWFPIGMPGAGDVALIGNLPAIENDFITLDVPATVAGLSITDGMQLFTNVFALNVTGNTSVSGQNILPPDFAHATSRLTVGNSPVLNDFTTVNLNISDDGEVRLVDHGRMLVHGLLDIEEDNATLRGRGTVVFTGAGTTLRNEGLIFAGGDNGLTFHQSGGGTYDLDGATGDGRLLIASSLGTAVLTLNGTALSDSFSGGIGIGAGATLHMNLSSGWTADASSTINAAADTDTPSMSRITGSPLQIGGELTVGLNDAHLRIEADTTIADSASIVVNETGLLVFQGDTIIEGGSFSTHSQSVGDGSVTFNGETNWQGTVTVDGVIRQNGHATVSGTTNVHGGLFDIDGVSGSTEWDIVNPLNLYVDGLDTAGSGFNGIMNVGATFFSNLNIVLSDPQDSWRMDGTLNLAGNVAFILNRLSGSPVEVTGDVNVSSRVGIQAPIDFQTGSTLNLANANTELVLQGRSHLAAGATVTGDGTLTVGQTGRLQLADSATTGMAVVENQGVLTVADQAGIAQIQTLQQSATGKLRFEIGGVAAGSDHDLLTVNGTAELEGAVDVLFIDAGNGLYLPTVGESFTVLTAAGGLNAAGLASDATTNVGGILYEWDVVAAANNVTVHLDSIGGLLGDYNADGFVNIADYLVWRNTLGGTMLLVADGSMNGIVDEADQGVWAANFGSSLGSGSELAGVPEPASSVLILAGMATVAWLLRHQSK